MSPVRSTLIVFVALASLAGQALPAVAFDLTGTWIGKWSCKGFDGQKFTTSNKTSTLRITQTGGTMAVDIDSGEFRYNGAAINDDEKPEKGEAVFAACPNDSVPLAGGEAEMVRASVKTKVGVTKASLKALSIFESDFGEVGTCKYSYKRTDTANPNTTGCPG